jgi:hypothetical protein
MAVPESRVLSEFMAFVKGREIKRIIGIRSAAKSKAPLRHIAHKELMPLEMVSHESSVSGRNSDDLQASVCCFKTIEELIG